MPVGALVFGRRSVQADVWLNDGQRLALDEALVVGNTLLRLTPAPRKLEVEPEGAYDRQVRMFGKSGQSLKSQQDFLTFGRNREKAGRGLSVVKDAI